MGRVFISLTLLIPTFSLLISPDGVTPLLQWHTERSATKVQINVQFTSSVHNLAPLNFQRKIAWPVSYYALFKEMAASKPISWLSQQSHILFHLVYELGTLDSNLGCFPLDNGTYLSLSDSRYNFYSIRSLSRFAKSCLPLVLSELYPCKIVIRG